MEVSGKLIENLQLDLAELNGYIADSKRTNIWNPTFLLYARHLLDAFYFPKVGRNPSHIDYLWYSSRT